MKNEEDILSEIVNYANLYFLSNNEKILNDFFNKFLKNKENKIMQDASLIFLPPILIRNYKVYLKNGIIIRTYYNTKKKEYRAVIEKDGKKLKIDKYVKDFLSIIFNRDKYLKELDELSEK